jgi:CBS domain-containing protein
MPETIYYGDADADVIDLLAVMEEHQVRRLPVVDDHRLVGMISEADIARHLPEHAIVQYVKAICSQPALVAADNSGKSIADRR